MRSGLVTVLVVALSGCSADDGDSPPYTTVPSLSDCELGDFFAECGDPGVDTPVFACSDGRCRWFRGSVVPERATVSPCPSDDICCVNGEAFSDEDLTANEEASRLWYGLDAAPWDRLRAMDLSVAVDPELAPPAGPAFTCDGSFGADGTLADPCTQGLEFAVGGVDQLDTVVIRGTGPTTYNFWGWYPWVELAEVDGVWRARACVFDYTDTVPGHCGRGEARCATGGTVIANAAPPAVPTAFELTATFDDGSGFTAAAALP